MEHLEDLYMRYKYNVGAITQRKQNETLESYLGHYWTAGMPIS